MKTFRLWPSLLAVLLSTSSLARDLDQDEALALRQAGTILPLEAVVERALVLYPGATLLEVELLTLDSVVRELELDARDARLYKDEVD